MEIDHYLNLIAKLINVSYASLDAKLGKNYEHTSDKPKKTISSSFVIEDKNIIEQKKIEDNFICLMVERKTLREFLGLVSPEMFLKEENRMLCEYIKKNLKDSISEKSKTFIKLENYVKIEKLLYEELYQNLSLNELHYEALRLRNKIIENYVKRQKKNIGQNLRASQVSITTRELLNDAKQLDQLLRKINEEDINEN